MRRRSGRMSRLRRVRDVLAVEDDLARGRFLQPHHQRARALICRNRIRQPGRPFRRATRRRSTPSTARSTRRWSRKFSRGISKCLTRPRTSSSGAGADCARASELDCWRCGGCRCAPFCVTQHRVLRDPHRSAAAPDVAHRHRSRTGSARGTGNPRATRAHPAADPRSSRAADRRHRPSSRGAACSSAQV